jgi:hypothetical protein
MGKSMDISYRIPIFDPPLVYDPNQLDAAGKPAKVTYLDPAAVLKTGKLSEHSKRCVEVKMKPETKKCANLPLAGDPARRQIASAEETRWTAFNSSQSTLRTKTVCERPNTVGPHFANIWEGKFCNMNDRSVWDLCNEELTVNCFDVETSTLYGPPEEEKRELADSSENATIASSNVTISSGNGNSSAKRRGRQLLRLVGGRINAMGNAGDEGNWEEE